MTRPTHSFIARLLFAATTSLGVAALLLAMHREPNPAPARFQPVDGVLSGLHVTGAEDVWFQLADDRRGYVVEQGLEHGIDAEALREELGQPARLFVLEGMAGDDDWQDEPAPGALGRVEVGDHVIYSAW